MVATRNREININWQDLQITPDDIQSLTGFLFETEEPLTLDGLTRILVQNRLELAKTRLKSEKISAERIYFPKDHYLIGEKIAFPLDSWRVGEVLNVRTGDNPQIGDFNVLKIQFDDGSVQEFASNLENHKLNFIDYEAEFEGNSSTESIIKSDGVALKRKLRSVLDKQNDLVRVGHVWFPKSLLIDIGQGVLNLAEALLDSHDGGPLGTEDLLTQLEMNNSDNPRLLEFSLNYALQEDPRFEEVGTTGIISWFLKRLEPEYVLQVPYYLKTIPMSEIPKSGPEATEKMVASLEDELGFSHEYSDEIGQSTETSVVLNFPHWRSGSLPITPNTRNIFPSALETEHVKISLVDEQSGHNISAWVVRPYSYVAGLREWYEDQNLIPGSIVELRSTDDPGVINIRPQKKRSNKEWIKTVLVGADGGLVIALLRQSIYAGFHDRMAIAIPDLQSIDNLWEERKNKTISLKSDALRMMQELSKLNNQHHVHFVDLYAAINIIRRTPPYDLLDVLQNNSEFILVGDHYFHLSEAG